MTLRLEEDIYDYSVMRGKKPGCFDTFMRKDVYCEKKNFMRKGKIVLLFARENKGRALPLFSQVIQFLWVLPSALFLQSWAR
jgi:hypothetical protein